MMQITKVNALEVIVSPSVYTELTENMSQSFMYRSEQEEQVPIVVLGDEDFAYALEDASDGYSFSADAVEVLKAVVIACNDETSVIRLVCEQ